MLVCNGERRLFGYVEICLIAFEIHSVRESIRMVIIEENIKKSYCLREIGKQIKPD